MPQVVKPTESVLLGRKPIRTFHKQIWRIKPTDTTPMVPLLDETQYFVPVVHRRHGIPLRKVDGRVPEMKDVHFVYDQIQPNVKKMPDVEIILIRDVPGKGVAGTKLKLPGENAYAEYLITQYAVYATPENEEKYQDIIKGAAKNTLFSTMTAQATSYIIPQLMVFVPMNMKNPWTIEKWHVRAALRQSGIIVADDGCLELPSKPISGPDPKKEGKHFVSTIIINGKERSNILCRINHFINDEDLKLPNPPLFTPPFDAVFEEDQALVDQYIQKRTEIQAFKF